MAKTSKVVPPKGEQRVRDPIRDTATMDLYIEMYETDLIPGGKASTETFRAQLERDIKNTTGK